jgi:hypothetical protein
MGGGSKKKGGKSSQKQQQQQQTASSAAAGSSSAGAATAADQAPSWNTWIAGAVQLQSANAAALLKGPQLDAVCYAAVTLLRQPQQQQQQEWHARYIITALQVLQKLFATRKRARDWKNLELSSKVCCVLAALEVAVDAVLQTLDTYDAAGVTDQLAKAALLQQTASAQGEVAQLLRALLQQQQLGQLPAEGAQQLRQLQQLACELLSCWMSLRQLVLSRKESTEFLPAVSLTATAAFLLDAVELAAVLAQSLGADSPVQHFEVVTRVVHGCVWGGGLQ